MKNKVTNSLLAEFQGKSLNPRSASSFAKFAATKTGGLAFNSHSPNQFFWIQICPSQHFPNKCLELPKPYRYFFPGYIVKKSTVSEEFPIFHFDNLSFKIDSGVISKAGFLVYCKVKLYWL